MKRHTLILVASALLAACGGSSDTNSSREPIEISSFTIDPYVEKSSTLTTDSIVGRWVTIMDIERFRYDLINASLKNKQLNSNVLRAFVIRPAENDTGYEISNCQGSFEPLLVSEDSIASDHYYALLDTNSHMLFSLNETRYVALSGAAGYTEDLTVTSDYRRVSDSIESFGSMSFNWSDSGYNNSLDVYCANIERYPEGNVSINFSSDDKSTVQIFNFINAPFYDAYISEFSHKGKITNIFGLGEQDFNFYENTAESIQVEYSATSSTGLSVVGQATINLM